MCKSQSEFHFDYMEVRFNGKFLFFRILTFIPFSSDELDFVLLRFIQGDFDLY